MKTLYPVQESHAAVLAAALENNHSALDASATGCGKTIVAAELVRESGNPALTICLKQSIPMWQEELAGQKAPSLGIINYEMLRTGRTQFGKFRLGQWEWKLPNDATIIWDEVHKCQGIDTLNSKMLISAKPYYNLMLSATAAKDPSEMRSLGFVLGLHHLRDFWSWAKDHGCSPNAWGKLDFYDDVDMRKRVLLKLNSEIFPMRGSRLTRNDLKDHFQETQIITTPIDFGPEIAAIYDEMEKEIGNLEEIMESDSKNRKAQALVAALRARQRVELLKVPYMQELASDLIAEGNHVVVFFCFDESINAFTKRFKHKYGVIRGSSSKTARAQAMSDYQNDILPCLVCNIQAGGTSLNLHDTRGDYPRSSLLSPGWNPKEVIQALGRIDRAGGATPTQQHVLFAAGTIEERVEKAVREGMDQIDWFNDGKSK